MKTKTEMIPAIFPDDYEGSVADWILYLIGNGYMKEGEFYGDIMIPLTVWQDMLEELEE